MPVSLLDVNVLLALAWPNHMHHRIAVSWFDEHASRGWATCPLTECGFIRISSNPRFTSAAVSPTVACQLLEQLTAHPMHVFWPDDRNLVDSFKTLAGKIVGHQQVTDGYLLGLARVGGNTLVTFDQAISTLAGSDAANIQIIGA